MALYVLFGTLAAFGLMCAVWVLYGLMESGAGGILIYSGSAPVAAAKRYLWLRELGILQSTLLILEPPQDQRQWLTDKGIEIISREALGHRLGIGAEAN